MMLKRNEPHYARESIIIGLCFLILYSVTLSKNLSIAHDSISYLNAINNGILYHPHHLLYNWLSFNWIRIWNMGGVPYDNVVVIEMLNALFGAMSLSLFFILLRTRFHLTFGSAIICTSLPAFSFGFWYYSTAIEVYIIPLFFILLTVHLLSSPNIGKKSYFLIGITHGLAILFHQTHAIFIVPILSSMILRRKSASSTVFNSMKYYLLSFLPIVLIPYLYVTNHIYKLKSVKDLYNWTTAYGHQAEFWSSFNLSAGLKAFVGFSRSLVGGHFIFAIPSGNRIISAAFRENWLIDDSYLTRNMNKSVAFILLALSLVLLALILISAISRIQNIRSLLKEPPNILWILIAWGVSYSIFFIFWEPSNVEFWIPQSLCFWLLLIMIWNIPQRSKTTECKSGFMMYSIIVILIFVINFIGSEIWLTNQTNDYYAKRIQIFQKSTSAGDLIIISCSWIIKDYLLYYTDSNILSLSEANAEIKNTQQLIRYIRARIEDTIIDGHDVYISEDAIDVEKETIRLFGDNILLLSEYLRNTYSEKWTKISNEDSSAYVLLRGVH